MEVLIFFLGLGCLFIYFWSIYMGFGDGSEKLAIEMKKVYIDKINEIKIDYNVYYEIESNILVKKTRDVSSSQAKKTLLFLGSKNQIKYLIVIDIVYYVHDEALIGDPVIDIIKMSNIHSIKELSNIKIKTNGSSMEYVITGSDNTETKETYGVLIETSNIEKPTILINTSNIDEQQEIYSILSDIEN